MADISFRARVSGNKGRVYLEDGSYLEISWYEGNWVLDVHIGHWEKDNPIFLSEISKTIFRVDRFLPRRLYEKYYAFRLNRLSVKVAKVEIC